MGLRFQSALCGKMQGAACWGSHLISTWAGFRSSLLSPATLAFRSTDSLSSACPAGLPLALHGWFLRVSSVLSSRATFPKRPFSTPSSVLLLLSHPSFLVTLSLNSDRFLHRKKKILWQFVNYLVASAQE